MSVESLNDRTRDQLPVINLASEAEVSIPREQRTSRLLVVGIVLLVLSILVLLVGLGFLIPGIIQAMPLLLILGASLIDFGILGILIAGLLIGLAQRRDNLLLRAERDEFKERSREEIAKSQEIINNLRQAVIPIQESLERSEAFLEDIIKQHNRQIDEKHLLVLELQKVIQEQEQKMESIREERGLLLKQISTLEERLVAQMRENISIKRNSEEIEESLTRTEKINSELEELQQKIAEHIKQLSGSLEAALKVNDDLIAENEQLKLEIIRLHETSSEKGLKED